jgi:hypothetical protein
VKVQIIENALRIQSALQYRHLIGPFSKSEARFILGVTGCLDRKAIDSKENLSPIRHQNNNGPATCDIVSRLKPETGIESQPPCSVAPCGSAAWKTRATRTKAHYAILNCETHAVMDIPGKLTPLPQDLSFRNTNTFGWWALARIKISGEEGFHGFSHFLTRFRKIREIKVTRPTFRPSTIQPITTRATV